MQIAGKRYTRREWVQEWLRGAEDHGTPTGAASLKEGPPVPDPTPRAKHTDPNGYATVSLPKPDTTGDPASAKLGCSDPQGGHLNGTYANDAPIYRNYGIPDVIPIPWTEVSACNRVHRERNGACHEAVTNEHVAEWSENAGATA